MYKEENQERNNRIKKFLSVGAGVALGAYALKNSNGLRNINKAFSGISKASSYIKREINETPLKEINGNKISSIIKKSFSDEDSIFKTAFKSTNIEIDSTKGLFELSRAYEDINQSRTNIINEIKTNRQFSYIKNRLQREFNEQSDDFINESLSLAKRSLKNQKDFFYKDSENILQSLDSEFEEYTKNSILHGHENTISDIVKEAINKNKEFEEIAGQQWEDSLQTELLEKVKENMKDKYSKTTDKFFKESLDHVATVNDFIEQVERKNIDIENNTHLNNFYSTMKGLVQEDSSFGELFINSSFRKDAEGNVYSSKSFNDMINKVKEETADTIFGKLFGARGALENQKAPDLYYIGKDSFDPVLAKLTNSKDYYTNKDIFKIGNKFYDYSNSSLNEIENSKDLFLISGSHGRQKNLLNSIVGNTPYKEQNNAILKALDLGNNKAINEFEHYKGYITKFKKDSDWLPKKVQSLLDGKYNNIDISDRASLNSFFKDIDKINLSYDRLTKVPSNQAINEMKKVLSNNTTSMLDIISSSDNIAEDLINSDLVNNNFINKDLSSLLKKYQKNPGIKNTYVKIGREKTLYGPNNVLKYDDILKREVIKEAMLQTAKEHGTGKTIREGYASTKSLLNKISVNGKDLNNINDLFNWSILQKEGRLFKKDDYQKINESLKYTSYKNINALFTIKTKNAQEQELLKSFQQEVKSFSKRASSIMESISDKTPDNLISTNSYVSMRKRISPLDIIKNLNDETKRKSTTDAFFKQFIAGRKNINDLTATSLTTFHFFNRLVEPLNSIGLGFSKQSTSSSLDLAKNIMLKRVLPIMGIGYGLSYINDLTRDITGTSLTAAALNTKARLTLGIKTIEDKLGFEDRNRKRNMYNPIAKYWLGDYMNKDEYLDYLEYGYDPVRKGRFWSFGSVNEFRGTKISYWKPNDLRLAHSNYYDISVYGSSSEKWAHSWLPTPTHPFAPIRRLLDPYWLEKKHYEDRPYPVTSKLFEEGSPWGAILNPTIGELIKPQKRMHQKELQGTLFDVKSIIEERNREIKRKSNDNRITRFDSSGFMPMRYVPYGSPSLSETVYTINTENGKIKDAGIQGSDYGESLEDINTVKIAEDNKISILGTTFINSNYAKANSSSYNSSIGNILTSIFNSKNDNDFNPMNIIANENQQIFRRSNEIEKGVIFENTKDYKIPINNYSEKYNTDYYEKIMNHNKSDFGQDFMNSTKELSGIYGFIYDLMMPASHGYRLENAGNINSFSRRFWDSSIGGTGGEFMEIARRFFPHEDHNITQINPIRNTMPSWLPDYFLQGDPYTKVSMGEARLPGKGYESLNKLHSDQYGKYGAFDRYKILADIAPNSEEYKTWKKIVEDTITDPFLLKQMEQINKRVELQNKEHDFYNYNFIGRSLSSHKGIIESVGDTGKVKLVGDEQTYRLAGITPYKDENGSFIHEYLKPGMQVTLKYEDNDYRKYNSQGEISALIYNGSESVSKQMFEDKKGKEGKKETLADEYFALSDTDITMGHIYEAIGHAQIPFLHNKFLRIESPLETYKKEQLYGNNFATWEHPIKGYLIPSLNRQYAKGYLGEAISVGGLILSNYASKEGWTGAKKWLAHGAFATVNPAGLAGAVVGYIPKLDSTYSRTMSNVFAIGSLALYGAKNSDDPLKSTASYAGLGYAIAKKLDIPEIGGKKGALIGGAVGLGISLLNPESSIKNINKQYIPKDTKKKWEIEEYFDRLKYIKYTNLYQRAARKAKNKEHVDIEKIINKYEYSRDKNEDKIKKLKFVEKAANTLVINNETRENIKSAINKEIYNLTNKEQYLKMGEYTKSALAYKKAAENTIYGLSKYSSNADILRALPKYDRDFFIEFAKEKDPKARKKILKNISPYKQKALKLMWNEDYEEQESNHAFFSKHKLPNVFWSGWDSKVDLENVKIKTIENEGLMLSDFGIYESAKNTPIAQNAPEIKDINNSSLLMEKDLICLLNGVGLQNVQVSVEQSKNNKIEMIANIARVSSYNINSAVNNVLFKTLL